LALDKVITLTPLKISITIYYQIKETLNLRHHYAYKKFKFTILYVKEASEMKNYVLFLAGNNK